MEEKLQTIRQMYLSDNEEDKTLAYNGIGATSKVGFIQVDGHYPNLALMQICKYHEDKEL